MPDAEPHSDLPALWLAMAADAAAGGDIDGARLLEGLAAGRVDATSPSAVENVVAVLAPAARADVLVAVGRGWTIADDADRAEAFLAAALRHVSGHLDAKLTLAQVRMPGPGYYELLDRVHDVIRPRTYLEIGMGDGSSMALARPGTLAVGVDPVPRLCTPVAAECRIFPQPSAEFFARADLDAILGGPPDLVFIDGLHTFPAVLDDLIGTERIAGPDTVVVLHDLLPLDEPTQRPDRAEGFYTGDVWKLLPCLAAVRPDLDVLTVRTAPSGLTFVRGLDPTDTTLSHRRGEILATFGRLPYDPATAPTGDIAADEWDAVIDFLAR